MNLYKIDDYFELAFSTQRFDTGNATDADALPTYRVYEENSDTAVATGNCAKRDDANTTGYYIARAQCTAAAGFEVAKTYYVVVTATVNSVVGSSMIGTFKMMYATAYSALIAGSGQISTTANGGSVSSVGYVTSVSSIAAGAINNATFASDVGSTAYATNIIALAVRKALNEINLDHLLAVTSINGGDPDLAMTEVVAGSVLSNVIGGNVIGSNRLTDINAAITAIATKLSGITYLAKWLRAMIRKDTADSTTKTEINLSGGTYNEATDSQEALRDVDSGGYII